MYSVMQYDITTKNTTKVVEGGYFSTRIYMCIHRNSIYLSSTLNKVIPLTSFLLTPEELAKERIEFPLFIDGSLKPNLKESTLSIDLAKLKQRKQSFSVDTGTAESSLFNLYVWVVIAAVFILLIYVSYFTPYNGTINMILIFVLISVIIFIIHSYI